MSLELRPTKSYGATVALFTFIAALGGLAFTYIGEYFLPLAAAALAALFLVEDPHRRIFSFAAPVLFLGLSLLTEHLFGLLALEILLAALMLAACYRRGLDRHDTAFFLTVLFTAFLVLTFIFAAWRATGVYTWQSVTEYYLELYETLKERVVAYLSTTCVGGTEGEELFFLLNPDQAEAYFNAALSLLPALILILAFLLAGLTVKIFVYLVRLHVLDGVDTPLLTRPYFTPNLIAYVAAVAILLSFFLQLDASGLTLGVLTAAYLFLAIYGYIGFRTLCALGQRRRTFTVLFLLTGLLLFSIYAVRVLAVIGLIYNIVQNRRSAQQSQ